MVVLWVLHINFLRRTFDQSLMKIFQRVQEIWSGQESVTEGQTAISIIPEWFGVQKYKQTVTKDVIAGIHK